MGEAAPEGEAPGVDEEEEELAEGVRNRDPPQIP